MAYSTATQVLAGICHDVNKVDQSADIDFILRDRYAFCHLPADAAAADATNYVLMVAEKEIELVDVKLWPSAGLTAHDTTYATLDINKDDGAGGSLTSLDSFTTKITGGTGNWAERVAEPFSGIVLSDTLTAGQCLVLEVTKASTGVAIPDCCVVVHYRLL